MTSKVYDVTIIGSGPSGLTAAIYTARANLHTLVIAGNPPGGQLTTTTDVENFPGFELGITGPELIEKMRKQAMRFGTEVIDQNVLSLKGSFAEGFTLVTDEGTSALSRSVIVATGASAKWLGLENEQRLRGKGVSACATCDGFFFKNKIVAVVGGGDSAMEESTFLTKFASKVYVLVRGPREQLRASKIMQTRALTNPKIEFIYNAEVVDVLGDTVVTGLQLKNTLTEEKSILDVQGLFLAIGHKPNTDFLKDLIKVDEIGYAQKQNDSLSSVPGVFVAGDVHDRRYRQAITAAGYGCMAAIDAEKFLFEHKA